jgi:thiol-disulfide isomerase/thioredoxin
MRPLLKIITILIVVSLILFSVYIAISIDSPESENNQGSDDNGENDNGQDDNNTVYKNFSHTVLIEEGTATWCVACPQVADLLYEYYKSGNYNFYYVALIEDVNNKAKNRLVNDYNIQAYPTMFIDGGYKVVVGSDSVEFEQALKSAESRDVPQIGLSLISEYDNNTNSIITNVLLENNERESYTGDLKIQLTEIISQTNNHDNKPYHYGFIGYMLEKEVTINSKGNITIVSEPYSISDLDRENLMVIATIFSKESVDADSRPDKEGGEFKAFYADATNATELVEGGNLPPSIEISMPEVGRLHILGTPVFDIKLKNTILVGRATIFANVEDESGVDKVEFYIDGELKHVDSMAPYEYSFRKVSIIKRLIRKYTFTVKAFDEQGKSSEVSLEVIAFFL